MAVCYDIRTHMATPILQAQMNPSSYSQVVTALLVPCVCMCSHFHIMCILCVCVYSVYAVCLCIMCTCTFLMSSSDSPFTTLLSLGSGVSVLDPKVPLEVRVSCWYFSISGFSMMVEESCVSMVMAKLLPYIFW